MKIYTGTGDSGRTSLFSGERLIKTDFRVEAYGTVDELCSFIGVVAAVLPQGPEHERILRNLQDIQADLFTLGAILATAEESDDLSLLRPLTRDRVDWLENSIDAMEMELPPLHSFILPGGHESAAWAHVARTVCRRAERKAIACKDSAADSPLEIPIRYINRLSDYLFVLARYLNKITRQKEVTWHE